jgi:pimeloyl-ACP methyl ester carboxylesterase
MRPMTTHHPPACPDQGHDLPPALPGERLSFDGLNCYRMGSGPPMLLIHSVNAAASAAEVRPLYERYGATRTVFALDLPGYGFSPREDRVYSPRLMTDALHTAADHIGRLCGDGPIDALAVSLGCEYLARAAAERPARWGRIALVSPTGVNGLTPRRGPPCSTREVPRLRAILSAPLWADGLFRMLTRPGVIRYFLERTFGGRNIDETMWAYDVLTTRYPGARYAPLYFLSGALFSADIHTVYEAVTNPVWVSHGVRGDFKDFRGLNIVTGKPDWSVTVFQSGAMPYFEMPEAFCAAFDEFLRRHPADPWPGSIDAP